MFFLVYMYYMHLSHQTSIVGKNGAYYIRIFTVCDLDWCTIDELVLLTYTCYCQAVVFTCIQPYTTTSSVVCL